MAKHLKLNKSTILVVGYGGAARGAAFALAEQGAKLAITGRNIDRVRALAAACGAEPLSREQAEASDFDALVHANPVGMSPHVKACFYRDRIPASLVKDMVYSPMETELVKRTRTQGGKVIPGLDMFIEQAARQFEIWTGQRPPRTVMQRAALEELNARAANA